MTENMLSLFKGFIPTYDKKPKKGYSTKKPESWMTYEEVKDLPEFAGVLADDTVLIDIDDAEQAEIMMNIVEQKQLDCKVLQTTRGKHFYFRNDGSFTNCGTHKKLACGLTADIKVGSKNSYAVLKYDGRERFTEWDVEDGESYQTAPKFLHEVKSSMDFVNLAEGDGRDSALYGYILNLQSAGLSKDETIECIKIINEHLLKDKMSDTDIERITRDEAFLKETFFQKGSFLFDAFARYMKSEHHIKRINGQLHTYKDGIYVPGYKCIEAAMIQHIPTLNKAKRREVLDYLELLCIEDVTDSDAKWVAFKNGILNIQDDTFRDFTPDIIITNIIPWDYNSNPYDDTVDKTLDKISCNDGAVRALLEEMAGSCLYRSNKLAGGKAFILTGSGSNGKSTYLNMIKNMLGKQNISVLDMKKFEDRFSTVMMYGKLANIGDDISSEFIADSATIKKVITGETISAEQKGEYKFNFEPRCKVIVSSNSIPRIGKGDDSYAIVRRFIIIPFNANFKKSDGSYDDPFISDKLCRQEAMEYLIKLGVEGLKRVLKNSAYTVSEIMEEKLHQYEEMNNPLLGFIAETDMDDILYQETKQVYLKYSLYCSENGLQALSSPKFKEQLSEKLQIKESPRKIPGANGNKKSARVYVKM